MSLRISDKNYPPPPADPTEEGGYIERSRSDRRAKQASSLTYPLHLENGDYVIQDRRLQPERRGLGLQGP